MATLLLFLRPSFDYWQPSFLTEWLYNLKIIRYLPFLQNTSLCRLIIYKPPGNSTHSILISMVIFGVLLFNYMVKLKLVCTDIKPFSWLLSQFEDLQQLIYDHFLLYGRPISSMTIFLCTHYMLFAIPNANLLLEEHITSRFRCLDR